MAQLDHIDLALLKYLQEHARFDIKKLSEQLNMSKTPIYERIRRLEAEKYITNYVALVDRKKVGVPLMVFCSVSISIQNATYIQQFREEILHFEEVTECYLTGGVFDFLLKVIVKDLEAYNHFASHKLANIPNVTKVSSSFVLDEMKHSTSLPLPAS